MNLYKITNKSTGEERYYKSKTKAAHACHSNTVRFELALLTKPFKNYDIEYADFNVPVDQVEF